MALIVLLWDVYRTGTKIRKYSSIIYPRIDIYLEHNGISSR